MQMQILLVKDSMGKAIFAHAVRKKAVDADGYAAQRLAEDLAWLAYTRLILKSDGENAIVRVLRETCWTRWDSSTLTRGQAAPWRTQ